MGIKVDRLQFCAKFCYLRKFKSERFQSVFELCFEHGGPVVAVVDAESVVSHIPLRMRGE